MTKDPPKLKLTIKTLCHDKTVKGTSREVGGDVKGRLAHKSCRTAVSPPPSTRQKFSEKVNI